MRHVFRLVLVLSLFALAAGACDREKGAATGAEKAADPPAPRAQGSLSDAQVMGVLVTANQGEIELSQAGMARLSDPAVKTFAQNMIQHHGESLDKAKQAASDAKLDIAKSDVTAKLESDARAETSKLQAGTGSPSASGTPASAGGGSGSAPDLDFMCAQIRLHKGVLDTIESQLAPAAQDARVKEQVSATRPVVKAHLEEAQGIVQKLSGKSADAACPAGGM
jgi:putative membrane protein